MNLAQKFKWTQKSDEHLSGLKQSQKVIASGEAQHFVYYFLVGEASCYALCSYLEGDDKQVNEGARLVVSSALDYFYGSWRNTLPARSGKVDPAEWRRTCLWYEVVEESLPWAAALGDWQAVKKIAEYPPDDAFPEAKKAKGETAWLRALICYLRGEPRANVEVYLVKAEADKSKRPKVLAPVLRALMDKDGAAYEEAFLAYLTFYRKSEFKLITNKVLALDGTTLYHMGRKQGFKVSLPENFADHIIRLD